MEEYEKTEPEGVDAARPDVYLAILASPGDALPRELQQQMADGFARRMEGRMADRIRATMDPSAYHPGHDWEPKAKPKRKWWFTLDGKFHREPEPPPPPPPLDLAQATKDAKLASFLDWPRLHARARPEPAPAWWPEGADLLLAKGSVPEPAPDPLREMFLREAERIFESRGGCDEIV